MRRFKLLWAIGIVALSVTLTAQPYTGQLAQALTQLTNGVITYVTLGMNAGSYINWGTGRQASGYGIRDSGGTIQVKNSGGSWATIASSSTPLAPADATYIVQTPNSTLTAEQALSSLGNGLVFNTTGTGVLSIYTGSTCVNQFPRSVSALGAWTCQSVSLTADVTGSLGVTNGGTGLTSLVQGDLIYGSAANTFSALPKDTVATRYLSNTGVNNNPAWAQVSLTTGVSGTLPVTNGGTGLASGTSGGILAFTGGTTISSSGVLATSQLVMGGGAGAAPATLGTLGTTTTVLHGNAGGLPTFGAVVLTTDVSGLLPTANGGTGVNSTATFPTSGVVTTDAGSSTFTNKTYDAEATGNILTLPWTQWISAGACDNGFGGVDKSFSGFTLTASGDRPVPTCNVGVNVNSMVLGFEDAALEQAQWVTRLPSSWISTVDVNLIWYSDQTVGNVVWQVASACVASGETGDPAYNTASTVTQSTQGVTLQFSTASITGLTMTGCAASEVLYLKVFRDPGHASDTMAGTAQLVGVELTTRRAL